MMKKITGFTLLELIIVILIFGVIAAASARLLSTGLSAYYNDKNVLDASTQARIALERMTRDLREVRTSSDITTATSSQFSFVDTSGNTVSYSLSGTQLMRNSQILADGISTLTFSYYDSSGNSGPTTANIRYISVTLNITQNQTNFSVATMVYPRNLN